MPVYPGDPEFVVRPWLAIRRGDPVNVARLSLGSHTGTHVDAPRHLQDGGAGVEGLPLEALLGPARVVDLGPVAGIDAGLLRRHGPGGLSRLLLRTSPPPGGAGAEHPGLTEDAAQLLVASGVLLLGVEGPSVDPPGASDLRVHRRLLGAGVVVVEGLDLSEVPAGAYWLVCLPLKLQDGDGAPARVVLAPAADGDQGGRRG